MERILEFEDFSDEDLSDRYYNTASAFEACAAQDIKVLAEVNNLLALKRLSSLLEKKIKSIEKSRKV